MQGIWVIGSRSRCVGEVAHLGLEALEKGVEVGGLESIGLVGVVELAELAEETLLLDEGSCVT